MLRNTERSYLTRKKITVAFELILLLQRYELFFACSFVDIDVFVPVFGQSRKHESIKITAAQLIKVILSHSTN